MTGTLGNTLSSPRAALDIGDIGRYGGPLTMSSREIAELVEKRHDNVMRVCRDLRDTGVCPQIEETPFTVEATGQTYIECRLNKRDSLVCVARLSPEFTARVVDRWMELEGRAASHGVSLPDFTNPAVAARAWAEQYEGRILAERTKAEIGTRREATAMNTASQAVKKANRLEIELDRSREYATVKRMQMLYHGQPFDWRLLKATAAEVGIPPIKVFDPNFDTVNAYHANVWREAYALEIPAGGDAGNI